MNPHTYYLDLFKVAKPQLETIAATALAHGGDYADLYFEHTTFFNLLLKDGVVSSGGFHTDYGVGIRVLKGEKTGYAYSENTEMPDMLKAAQAASSIALGASGNRTYSPVEDRRHDLYPMKRNWRDNGADAYLPFLKELEKEIFSRDSRIVSGPTQPAASSIARSRAVPFTAKISRSTGVPPPAGRKSKRFGTALMDTGSAR
jgi:TldD protein